ncbi:peptidyl-dipeptidase Dcp [Daejeonella sp. JGW-45]|uniref:peptidyl-dipeptidase Dcp n=1 Tax=Daejeonella sp. JGW-45 TaxID=3034148 RepID=UPI0023ED3E13|nr:peptidyl-dipeptidase Dcp [Daejeonella sp. JGW-45]
MNYTSCLVLAVIFTASQSNTLNAQTVSGGLDKSNPFYQVSSLPFHAPAFDKIKNSDFKPAIEEGIRQQMTEIRRIADNPAAPTFQNTLVEMEKSGRLLSRAGAVLNLLTGAYTNPELQKVQQEMAPKLSANNDAIYLNTKLFKRVEAIYNQRHKLKLDPESARLIEYYHQNFVAAGAKLSEADKEILRKLNQEEATLRTKFGSQLLAGTRAGALIVNTKEELEGLSDAAIEVAAGNAKAAGHEGKYAITLQNTTQQPELTFLRNRATRQKLFEASWNRTEKDDANDTRAIIARLAQIRAQKARMIGFPSFAAWKLQNQMAKTPETVEKFLAQLVPAATAKAREEAAEIQKLIDQQNGGFKLEAWDWNFYSEQLRKMKFDIDENEIKPYLEIDNVLQKGVFYAANLLYGLTFKERKDLPVYQEDVRVFDVFDKDGKQMALFYADYYKRDNKRGGAWMSNLVGQSRLFGTRPVIYNVCNFTKPAPGQPALISYSDMRTMFHEFGHALHGLFADQQYPSLSGTATARDFVEFPSQVNENWALDPKVINNYALHYKTGEVMPQALIDKIKKAGTFNQGHAFTEVLAAHNLDLQWHSLKPGLSLQDVNTFEAEALRKTGLDFPQVPPRYRSSYFNHIWNSGYSAGYYAYSWTEMLADDAYSWFVENGGLTRANGQRFRDMVLSRGNTIELGKMYRDFRGHDPDIKPMLKSRGLED